MNGIAGMGFENVRLDSVSLYDRLERALIVLEYALADARQPEDSVTQARSQEALLSAGDEVQGVLALLKNAALGEAAARARSWN